MIVGRGDRGIYYFPFMWRANYDDRITWHYVAERWHSRVIIEAHAAVSWRVLSKGEGMDQDDASKRTGGMFAQMQTDGNSKNANDNAMSSFRRLGRQLALAPTPASFGWMARLLLRSAGIANGLSHTSEHLSGVVSQLPLEGTQKVEPLQRSRL